jgi:hypothetical protein
VSSEYDPTLDYHRDVRYWRGRLDQIVTQAKWWLDSDDFNALLEWMGTGVAHHSAKLIDAEWHWGDLGKEED